MQSSKIKTDVNLLGYQIYAGRLEDYDFTDKKRNIIVNTINAYSYVITKQDNDFKRALQNSDILLPDGFPIVFASKFLYGIKIKKIAGEDIFKFLMHNANSKSLKVFFLGSSIETLEKIKSKSTLDYPNVTIGYYSPPYKSVFNSKDNEFMTNVINVFQPDILFIGMTAPKQEKWVQQNKNLINSQIICSIGAVFDFYAGTNKRPSKFWVDLRLEWFIRLLKEPKRLWKRYLLYSPLFFIDVVRAKIK